MNSRMNTKDAGNYTDIREIWDAIEREYKTFSRKYNSRKRDTKE